jgi:hypothetical protein
MAIVTNAKYKYTYLPSISGMQEETLLMLVKRGMWFLSHCRRQQKSIAFFTTSCAIIWPMPRSSYPPFCLPTYPNCPLIIYSAHFRNGPPCKNIFQEPERYDLHVTRTVVIGFGIFKKTQQAKYIGEKKPYDIFSYSNLTLLIWGGVAKFCPTEVDRTLPPPPPLHTVYVSFCTVYLFTKGRR